MKGVRIARKYCRLSARKKASLTLCLLEARPIVAGYLETAVTNLGPYPRHQNTIAIQVEIYHHPVEKLRPLWGRRMG